MNYKHLYHAGNFADIFKHLILIFCLEKMHEKESAFLVIDTHSGNAKYNIKSNEALKTGETFYGIINFLKQQNESPLLANFFKILRKINRKNDDEKISEINFYPGSPYIIRHFIRKQDRAIFNEMNRVEFLQLKKNIAGAKNIFFNNEDGFSLLKSKLPPLEKRALVLIDPAFEKNSDLISKDYDKIISALNDAYKRFANGIYLVWYPIINKENEQKNLQKFYQDFANLKFEKVLNITYAIKNSSTAMNSCGMFIVNAPWQIEEKISAIFKENLKIESL